MTRGCGCGAALLAAILCAGCGAPKPVALPTASGTPLADITPVLGEALGHCDAVRTLTAEIGLSGRAGRQRLRVRLIAGLAAPDGIRLEAVAPMGPPVFILASAGDQTTLLLPRDDRVLTGQPPQRFWRRSPASALRQPTCAASWRGAPPTPSTAVTRARSAPSGCARALLAGARPISVAWAAAGALLR